MINIIQDDIMNHIGEYDLILIGTNTYCTMSQGLQLQVMLNYPYVMDANISTKYGDKRKLGTICEASKDGDQRFCLCFINNGYNFRPDKDSVYLDYDALRNVLNIINIRYRGQKIATTLMGSSKFDGNGNRDIIQSIFSECCTDIDIDVYDYKQLSRSEWMKEIYKAEKKVKKTDPEAYYKMVSERKKEAEERFKKNKHRRY